MNKSTARRTIRGLATASLALALLATTACGSDDAESSGSESKKVAVLTSGTINDGSWGQSVNEGALAAAEEYDVEVKVSDNLDTPQQFQQLASGFAQQGYDLIVVANGAAAEVVDQLSRQFPKVKFGGMAQNIKDIAPNARTVTPIFQETAFLAGVAAGDVTKSKIVATIGGFEFPVLNNEMEGFALGARFADPKIQVKRSFINTWTDAGKGRAAAAAAMSQGADVIFSATDQATQGMVQAMQKEKEHYVITQYADDHESAPKVILTSALYGLDEITGSFVKDMVEDSWKNENVLLGLKDIGKLADFNQLDDAVSQETKDDLAAVEAAIKSGCLTIPDGAALAKSGSADDVDVAAMRAAFEKC